MSQRRRVLVIAAAVVAAVVVLPVLLVWWGSSHRLNRRYQAPREALTYQAPTPEMADRGFAVAVSHACTHCHGQSFGGAAIPEMATFGLVVAPNLTRGGRGATLSEQDWARAIRFALGPDGRPLLFMPLGHHYTDLSDEEVGAVIAYARSVPPVRDTLPAMRLSPLGRLGVATSFVSLHAEVTDFSVRPYRPTPGASVANGRYLAQQCTPCHAADLGGMTAESHPRPGTNLTRSGRLGSWTEEQFLEFFRSGRTPDGRTLDPRGMPWKAFGLLREDELRSIWLYLREAPPSTRGAPATAAAR